MPNSVSLWRKGRMPLSTLWRMGRMPRFFVGCRGTQSRSGQEPSGEEEKLRAALARDAKVGELDAWRQFRVFEHFKGSDVSNAVVSTRWVLARQMVDSKKCVKARPVAKGYQDPDLRNGLAGTSWLPLRLLVVGGYGASTLRTRSSEQMDLDVTFFSNPRLNGSRGIPVVFGN